jgi:hypothetical protein
MMANLYRLCSVLVLFAFSASIVNGGEDYFLVMLGSQTVPANPNHSHTWATFVRVTWPGDGPCPSMC